MMLTWVEEEGGEPVSEGSPSLNTGFRITKTESDQGVDHVSMTSTVARLRYQM